MKYSVLKTSYLNSKETKKELQIQDCHLAHIRNSGMLKFTKKGNAFLYDKDSIQQLKKITEKEGKFKKV